MDKSDKDNSRSDRLVLVNLRGWIVPMTKTQWLDFLNDRADDKTDQ